MVKIVHIPHESLHKTLLTPGYHREISVSTASTTRLLYIVSLRENKLYCSSVL